MLALPAQGTITAFEPADQVGRIRLGSGDEVRFGGSACIGFVPAIGAAVWVVRAEPPLGGFRAKVVNVTGEVQEDRATAAQARFAQEEQKRLEWLAASKRAQTELRDRLRALPSPWRAAGQLADSLASLRGRLDLEVVERIVGRLCAVDDKELALTEFAWADSWESLPAPCDPYAIPIAAADGDALVLLAHPLLLATGTPLPVAYLFHESDPPLSWVAESVHHLERMIATAVEKPVATAIDAARGTLHERVRTVLDSVCSKEAAYDEERKLVWSMYWEQGSTWTGHESEKLYAAAKSEYALTSIRAQRALLAAERAS